MLAKHPLNAVLWATLLLMGAVSSATGATSNSVSGEGQDVRMLNALTTDSVIAGSTLTYSALAFVNDPGPVTNLTISLPMPTGTGMVSVQGPGGGVCNAPAVGANGSISCTWPVTFGSIINSRMLTAVVSVPPGIPTGTLLTTTISAAADEGDPDPLNNALTLATTVIAPGDQHVSVPTMGSGGLILLSLLLGVCGMMAAARRQA